MFPKFENKKILLSNGSLLSEYRSYESYILQYLDEKQLLNFKATVRQLFKVIPDNSLVAIYKKIKKNYNKPSFIEEILLEYFDKFNVNFVSSRPVPLTRKNRRLKENKLTVNERVRKYRKNTKKVSFQCMISKELKKELMQIKKEKNITYEQLLFSLIH